MLGMASLLHHRKCVIMGACLCLAGLGTLQLNVKRPILVDEITEKERYEVGSTPYFQALCKRNDILPLPLNCSGVSNANLTDDADYSRLPLFLDCYNNISAKYHQDCQLLFVCSWRCVFGHATSICILCTFLESKLGCRNGGQESN